MRSGVMVLRDTSSVVFGPVTNKWYPSALHFCSPRSGQLVRPSGRMPRPRSLGVHPERCTGEPWLGSALWQSAFFTPRLSGHHLLRSCPHPDPCLAFPSTGRGPGRATGGPHPTNTPWRVRFLGDVTTEWSKSPHSTRRRKRPSPVCTSSLTSQLSRPS